MKKIRKVIAIFCLIIFYCYFINIVNFPSKILVYSDSKLNYKLCPFLNLKGEVLTSTTGKSSIYNVKLSLGNIDIKNIELKKAEKIEVVPCGEVVGLKIYTKGIVIVGFSEIEDINGNKVSLENTTSLKKGEKIVEVNSQKVSNIDELRKAILLSKNEILEMKIEDDMGNERIEKVAPIHDSSNSYKLGLWVKDAATGVGTLSFVIPETNQFACLGHGIVDVDTGNLLEIEDGNLTSTKIITINKGNSGNPGEIKGTINNDNLGEITDNTNFGIFGNLTDDKKIEYENQKKIPIGLRSELELGPAKIVSNFNGEKKEYDIMIDKIYLNDLDDNKNFVIRIIDQDLINETGGIIRGLSRKSYFAK